MKDYLKMEDAFQAARVGNEPVKPWVNGEYYVFYEMQAEYAAHAINSHDELVAMNEELLAALKMVWSSAAYAHDGLSGQYVTLDDERELINSLLERCDGGVA